MKVKIKMHPVDKILLKRNLNLNGEAQKYFTHEVRRLADDYVPMQQGTLKDTAIERTKSIEYVQPYARRQYWENKGDGHLRGKQWDKRMWADRGPEIVLAVAKYVGGKAE